MGETVEKTALSSQCRRLAQNDHSHSLYNGFYCSMGLCSLGSLGIRVHLPLGSQLHNCISATTYPTNICHLMHQGGLKSFTKSYLISGI